MGFYESFILTFIDAVMILLLVHSIKKNLKSSLVSKIIFIIVNSISISLLSLFVDNKILSHILCASDLFILLAVYLYVNGSKNMISNTLIYFVNTILIIIVQLIVVLSMNVWGGSIEYSFLNAVVAQLVGLAIVLAAFIYVPLSYIEVLIDENNTLFRILITSIFVIYYSVTILWLLVKDNLDLIIFGLMIVFIFAITIITLILREGYLSNAYKDKLSAQETYSPIIDDMIEELKNQQHDYHNQIQTILAMKRDDSILDEDIEEYVSNIQNRGFSSKLAKLGNRIIGAFLYSKINEAESKGVTVNVAINCISFASIYETYQLIEMYGILIDNAVEAVDALDGRKRMDLLLSYKGDMYTFEVRNDYRYISVAEISSFFKKGFSSKSGDKRGIGLHKLNKMLRKYDGDTNFYYDTEISKVVAQINHK